MNVTFVEAVGFTRRVRDKLDDADYRRFQSELLENPEQWGAMPGCGGLRKARWAERGRGKGKRSGVRVIYLWIPDACRIDLLDIYGKDEKDDLTAAEKKALAALAKTAKREATAAYRRSRGER